QAVPAALSQPRDLLRTRRQPVARPFRGSLPAAALPGGRRLHSTRRHHDDGDTRLRSDQGVWMTLCPFCEVPYGSLVFHGPDRGPVSHPPDEFPPAFGPPSLPAPS